METTDDELAGIVDLFGGLTRPELERALEEVAFRSDGQSVEVSVARDTIDGAIAEFGLLALPENGAGSEEETLLVPGPTALPRIHEHAEDLPHILDIDPRDPARQRVVTAALERFEREVERAVSRGDHHRCETLLEVSYDLEAWADVNVSESRDRLLAVTE